MTKKRLDIILVERGIAPSRQKAQALIMAGCVLADDKPAEKAGAIYSDEADIRLRGEPSKYVSRGGDKLEGALVAFELDVTGFDALDVGASTGGFTDCLLQRGARSVCALDVGYGQLATPLRGDPRVTVVEKTNARNIRPEDFGRAFDLITVDVSFISLAKILPALIELLNSNGMIVALVKPQFEAGRDRVGKGGVVRDPETHESVLRGVMAAGLEIGLYPAAATHSPLPGPKGNIEFFVLFSPKPLSAAAPDPAAVVSFAHLVLNTHQTIDT